MVDAIEYYVGETKEIIPIVGMDDVARGISQCLCHVCLKYKDRTGRMKASAFTDYDFIIPKKTKELTSHQYFLCPPGINAYVFSDRAWGKRATVLHHPPYLQIHIFYETSELICPMIRVL